MLSLLLHTNKKISSVGSYLVLLAYLFPIAVCAEWFTIPAQSMDSALREYSKQSRRQVFFLPSVTQGKNSRGVTGELDGDRALEELLRGSGLTYKKDSRGGISVIAEQKKDILWEQGTTIDEIIVKAQKHSEDAQRVGISMDVFTELDIKQLDLQDTSSVGAYSTNVSIANINGATQPSIFIRGVGLNDTRINNTPPVGMYVDEIFMSSTALMGMQILDVERIEILKGPQGTLYGKNTTAGTLSFYTKNPSNSFERFISVGVGNYNLKEAEAIISGPLFPTLQARLAIKEIKRDGHQKNTFLNEYHGGVDIGAARFTFAWQPRDNVNVTLKINGANNNSQGYNVDPIATGEPSIIQGDGPMSRALLAAMGDEQLILDPETVTCEAAKNGDKALANATCTDFVGYADNDGDANIGQWNVRPIIDNKTRGFSSLVEWEAGSVLVTSVTGFMNLSRERHEDRDGSPHRLLDSVYINDLKQLSQEVRFTSVSASDLDWIVGAFYSSDKYDTTEKFDFSDNLGPTASSPSLFVPVTQYEQTTTSAALFSHLEYKLSESWRGILGLRYTWEKKEFEGGSFVLIEPGTPFDSLAMNSGLSLEAGDNGILPLFGASGCIFDGTEECKEEFDAEDLSGKLALEYMANEGLLVYGSFSNGFKSGGINGSIGLDPNVYKPVGEETIWSYELGVKKSSQNKKVRFNTALFYYEYEDLQFKDNILFNVESGFGFPYTELTNSGEANALGGEMDVWWRVFRNFDVKLGLSYINFSIDSKAQRLGNTQTHTPEKAMNFGCRYQKNLNADLSMALAIDGSWQGEVFQDAQNSPILKQDSYKLFNGRISLFSNKNHWTLTLWGRNLTDEQYSQFGFNLLGGIFSLATEVPALDRTYGLKATYRFD
jgi:iron complex outermembrane recepter protein